MKTPQLPYSALAKIIGVPELYLKREDEHHFGSHKGRSIPHMIDLYRKEGVKNFVISSSGNAALAAILCVQTHNANSEQAPLSLHVFLGKRIPEEKLSMLTAVVNDRHVILKQVDNPKQHAFLMDKDGKAKNLRQSTDDQALLGYAELATELNHIPNLQAIFIPTSSGTTAQGLGEAFQTLAQHPQIHIVQTTSCHPIAGEFNSSVIETKDSLASAIVDNIAHRKAKVVEAIKNSHGSGWIVTDDEIKNAMKLVKDTESILVSPNSALSVAGAIKAVKSGWKLSGVVVCLITGR